MLRPTQMAKIDLQVSEAYITKVTMVIAQLKSLHLLNVRKMPLGQNDFESNQENVFINQYKQLNHRFQNICKSLGLAFEIPDCPVMKNFDPFKDIVKIENEIQAIETDLNEVLRKIKSNRESNSEKQELLRLSNQVVQYAIAKLSLLLINID